MLSKSNKSHTFTGTCVPRVWAKRMCHIEQIILSGGSTCSQELNLTLGLPYLSVLLNCYCHSRCVLTSLSFFCQNNNNNNNSFL